MGRLAMGGVALLLACAACGDEDSQMTPITPADGGTTADAPLASVDAPPAGSCGNPTGPTMHTTGSVGDETWTAALSPHVITVGTNVNGTLTIEPCAEVLIGPGVTITVRSTGRFVASGTASQPIHIGQSGAAPFASIRAFGGGTLRLAHVTIDGGGDPLNTVPDLTGVFFLQGVDGTMPTQETLFVDHVSIAGSRSNGIAMIDGAGFAAGSTDLTVTGAAQFPVSLWARAVGGLPTGSYTGNAHDEILIPATGGAEAVQEDTTMHNRGVPYRIGNSGSGGTLYIGRTEGLATLTIEAGTVLKVKKNGVIYVERFTGDMAARGALIAVGTESDRVVFTSAEASPAAGDWLGIYYGMKPTSNNRIEFARVEYAGGRSASQGAACNDPPAGRNNDGAIRIFGAPLGGQFVRNTIISDSDLHGIDRGWRDDNQPDFLATNTFVNVLMCNQTFPRAANGFCPPDPAPCPK